MKSNSVWKVRIPKYLSFLIILLITTGLAFSIIVKAQKRAGLLVEENRFFYWKVYENELIFFRFPSNYFIQENNEGKLILKDELRKGEPELSVWFSSKEIEQNVLSANFENIIFKLVYDKKQEIDYENEFNLIIESVKIK